MLFKRLSRSITHSWMVITIVMPRSDTSTHCCRVSAEDAVLVFDDIDWSAGMRDAWRVIQQDGRIPGLQSISPS